MKWFQTFLGFTVEELLPRVLGVGVVLLIVCAVVTASEPGCRKAFPPRPSTELALPNGHPIRLLCFCNKCTCKFKLPPGIKSGDQLLRESRKPTVTIVGRLTIPETNTKLMLLRFPDGHEYWVITQDKKASKFEHSHSCDKCKKEKEAAAHARPRK